MKIVFSERAVSDLVWWQRYYRSVFPDGRARAQKHFRAARDLLLRHPEIGRPRERFPHLRELQIARTPFSILYTVGAGRIFVLRVLDHRAAPVEAP